MDRVADVFPDEAAIVELGCRRRKPATFLAVLGRRPVGVPANRIPNYLRRLPRHRFSEWQAEVDTERAARGRRRQLRLVVDDTRHADAA